MTAESHPDPWQGLFDGRLDVAPPLTDEQLAAVPAKRGVFFLAGSGGEAVLLATAASIRSRLRGRLDEPAERAGRRADLRAVTRRVYWKLAGGHFETDWRYLEMARRIWPGGYARMLSWRPAWFVRVDGAADWPHFHRTREVCRQAGRVFGPFPDGRSAERFVGVIADAFDLCRDVRCLRRSPNGAKCSYGQMGRCLSPCDGSVSMDAYRVAVAEAAEFAAGRRAGRAEELRRQMRRASADLQFERAAALKARLDRLAELDGRAFQHVAPLEQFAFVLVQPSGSRRRLSTFFVNGGCIAGGPSLPLPPADGQLRQVLDAAAAHMAGARRNGDEAADRWGIGLVAHYLFAGPKRRGVVLRWREGLTAGEVGSAVAEYLAS